MKLLTGLYDLDPKGEGTPVLGLGDRLGLTPEEVASGLNSAISDNKIYSTDSKVALYPDTINDLKIIIPLICQRNK